jgi:hypothetical protein
VTWTNLSPSEPPPPFTVNFSDAGLTALAQMAGMHVLRQPKLSSLTMHDAILGHGPLNSERAPPCARLADGTGVWVRLGNPNAHGAKNYCPFRHPAFYGA